MGCLKWGSKEVEEWKKIAESHQSGFQESLGNVHYETFGDSTRGFLRLKVGYSIFPEAGNFDETAEDIIDCTYNEKQNGMINDICKKIWTLREEKKVKIGFIFIDALLESMETKLFPVYRIHKGSDVFFIDLNERIYSSWENFLDTNRLPKCFFCYPNDGVYGRGASFAESKECKTKSTILKTLDWTSVGAAVASSVVFISLPASGVALGAAAVAGVASGLWGSGRSIATLVDRKTHDQSISLKSSESRGAWLNVAAGAVGTVAVGAKFIGMLSQGAKFARPAMIGCGVASASVGGASIADSAVTIVKNKKAEREEIMNLALAIFFFTSSVHSLKTAASMKSLLTTPIEMVSEPSTSSIMPSQGSALKCVAGGSATGCSLAFQRTKKLVETAQKILRTVDRRNEQSRPNLGMEADSPAPNTFINKSSDSPALDTSIHKSADSPAPSTSIHPSADSPAPNTPIDERKRDEWIFIRNQFFERIGRQITHDDYQLIFGELDLLTVFDHLPKEEKVFTFKMLESQIYGTRFDFILEVLVSSLRIRKLHSAENEPLNIFFVKLMDDILYYISFHDPTDDELWDRAIGFSTK